MTINAWAATAAGEDLTPFEYEPGDLAADAVHVKVESCGICHSDLNMLNNDWGIAAYPLVPGHEVIGIVEQKGADVSHLEVGQRVGIGWQSSSCAACAPCTSGNQQFCPSSERTIVHRHGGFADALRIKATFALPIPDALDPIAAGPLLCGGITVFDPLYSLDIKPTAKVGIVGIGGLGHLALQFTKAWGCEVTAFTSTAAKGDEARLMGAHHVASSTDDAGLKALRGQLDLIIVTVDVELDWNRYLQCLAPNGRLHFVGMSMQPLKVPPAAVINPAKQISGSPIGSPATIKQMLDFAARHNIQPVTEVFDFDQVNEAIEHLKAGKARYRIVLKH